jgi:apolipoprotein D and lipocalin family protein
MQFFALLVPALAASAAASSLIPSAPVTTRQTTAVTVNTALYDGTCYYPTADPNFPDISEYLGRWYQVAGSIAIFTLGCSCVYADYTLNDNGTIGVFNGCQLGTLPDNISGLASPVDPAYGAKGALQVTFPIIPGGGVTCPGPNYIVQSEFLHLPAARLLFPVP